MQFPTQTDLASVCGPKLDPNRVGLESNRLESNRTGDFMNLAQSWSYNSLSLSGTKVLAPLRGHYPSGEHYFPNSVSLEGSSSGKKVPESGCLTG